MRLLFACGGSGGHINPALAIASAFKTLFPDCEILFIGGQGNIECELVPNAGFSIKTISADNLRRSIKPKDLMHNAKAAYTTVTGLIKAKKIIKEFNPDAVIGTGGYVCYPALKSAAALNIPTILHESNVLPGLTTRMLEKHVTSILLGFSGCEKHYKYKQKLVMTGTPIRTGFRKTPNYNNSEKPLVLSL